jgi:hypothetical protein
VDQHQLTKGPPSILIVTSLHRQPNWLHNGFTRRHAVTWLDMVDMP